VRCCRCQTLWRPASKASGARRLRPLALTTRVERDDGAAHITVIEDERDGAFEDATRAQEVLDRAKARIAELERAF
jgi:hypothetical protein